MDEAPILAKVLVPANMYELIMVTLRVKNLLQFHLAIGWLVTAMPLNDLLNVLTILR
jgi:hypothetical protein